MSDLSNYDPQPAFPQQPARAERGRFQWTFSLGTLLWLMLVVGIALAWWNDRRQFDARLRKIELMYQPQVQTLWSAADALGVPDDPMGTAGKSWCPQGSAAADWIELDFDRPVAAASIELYETYSLGCVTEVIVTDRYGNQTSIFKGSDPTTAPKTATANGLITQASVFSVPVPKSVASVQRVKVHVDSVGKSPWPCIDAVGLRTAGGKVTWASASTCSSVYGNSSLTAAKKKGGWTSWW